ncbi:MAG: SGNH/GDSL hydrolase family protein [Dehalococcoidia bacterium]|nr:SGNH/GDSL hydrolase family protein [Dehalococcoidia bacterium]
MTSMLLKLGLGAAGVAGFCLLLGRSRPKPPYLTMGDSIAEGLGRALERLVPGQAFTEARSGEGSAVSGRFASARLRLHPEARTVILSTGVNSLGDKTAAQVMDETVAIVDQMRALGCRVVLVGPPPAFGMSESTNAWRMELAALERLHGRMAGRISLWRLLGDPTEPGYFAEQYGTPGGLHPNAAGYERAARAVLG